LFASFSEDIWRCIDAERGEYCLKKRYPSRVNYLFLFAGTARSKYGGQAQEGRQAVSRNSAASGNLDKGKKLKKKFLISNNLILALISLQTKFTKMTEAKARSYILERTIDGREGFFCLMSNMDLDLLMISQKYRDKDCVKKLFSSMKSDIGIRPIRTWTDNGVYGVF